MATQVSLDSTVIARVATGLYNVQIGYATTQEALAAINGNAYGSVEALVDALYTRDFGGMSNAAVASMIVENVGITGAATVAEATAYITAALDNAAAGHKGATVVGLMNLYAGLTLPTYVAPVAAFNQQVQLAVLYGQSPTNMDDLPLDAPSETVFNIAGLDAAGADVMRLTGNQDASIDFTNRDKQLSGLDIDGDGLIEANGSENNRTALSAEYSASGFEIVDAYSRNPLDHTDTANNFLGDITFQGTGYAGDGVATNGNIFLGGLGADTVTTGIGNDFLAGGGIAQGRDGFDSLNAGRNADFIFAEFSFADETDGSSLFVDGGNTADDSSAGNTQTAQDSDWILFEASDDDEPVHFWLNDDNVGATEPDGIIIDGRGLVQSRSGETMVIDDIENIDASGNLYGFLDDVDVEIGGRAVDDRDEEGAENYGIGSSAQLNIEGSEAGNKLIGGYDNDYIGGNGGNDLIFGGNLQFFFETVEGGVTNPNLEGIVNDGMDELFGDAGNDSILLELDEGVADGGTGTDTLWITNYTVGRTGATEAASAAAILGDGIIRIDLGWNSYRGYRGDTLGESSDHSDEANDTSDSDHVDGTADQTNYADQSETTVVNFENVIATGMGAIDYLAAGSNDPDLVFNNEQNFYGTAVDLELRGTDGDTVVFFAEAVLFEGDFSDADVDALWEAYIVAASVDLGDLMGRDEFEAYLTDGEDISVDETFNVAIDAVTVKTGNNVLYAGAGDDILEGRGGDDSLSGGAGNDDFVFGLEDVYGHGSDHGDSVDVIHRQQQDADKEANITDGTFGQDFGLDESSVAGESVLRVVIQKSAGNAAGEELDDVVNFVSEIVTGIKNADGTFTPIVLNTAAIKAATTYSGLTDAINDAIDALYPDEADHIEATLQSDGISIFITDSEGRELADNIAEVPGAGITINQKANTDTENVFEFGAPEIDVFQDRIIYKSYEDRSKNEGTDDDAVLGSTISLGEDNYANDLVIDFQADSDGVVSTRLAEDQEYVVTLTDLSVEDIVTISVNGVKYTLQVGVALDGTLINGESNDAFVERMADYINTFLDDDTAAGKLNAEWEGDNALTITQAAYSDGQDFAADGEEVVFMRKPVVTINNLSGGQRAVSAVTNISSHEVLLLDFDGRNSELDRDNVLFVGEEFIQRSVLQTALDAGETLLGSDAMVVYVANNSVGDNITSSADEALADGVPNDAADLKIEFNTVANQATLFDENFAVHGDDLLIGGNGLDSIWGGTGDDRFHGSTGGTATTPERVDGGKDLYLVDHVIRVLNDYEAEVVASTPSTISIEKIQQTETGGGLEDGFEDTLLWQQGDFGVVGAGGAKFYIELSNDLDQKQGGEGWVTTTEGAATTGFTYFTNMEHIRTVSGDGTLAGQGDDTLDFADLSLKTGGVFYNLSNNTASEANNGFPDGTVLQEAGPGSVIINFGENWDFFLDDSETAVGDDPIEVDFPSVEDAGADGDTDEGDDELFIVVDGVENVIGGTGDDGVYVDETEAGKNNLFSLALGDDIVLYGNAFDEGAHLRSGQVPSVTIKVNTGTDTDTIEMVGGRVGTVAAKDTLTGVEAVSFTAIDPDNLDNGVGADGGAASSSREDDVLDVSRVAGATVDFTNGYVTTGGTIEDGGSAQLIVFGMAEFETVVGSANSDTVVVADLMFNSREDSSDFGDSGEPEDLPQNVQFDSFLNYDLINDADEADEGDNDGDNDGKTFERMSVAELRAVGTTGGDVNPFGEDDIPESYNIGQYEFNLGGGSADTVDYFDEEGLIVAVIKPGSLANTILVSHDGDEDLTDDTDRVDLLTGVERVVAASGDSILDFTDAGQDVKIDFEYSIDPDLDLEEDDVIETTVRIADGNGNQIQGISTMVERYNVNALDDTDTTDDATWNRIEGSDFAEIVTYDGSEAISLSESVGVINQVGVDHRFSDDTLNLRGGNNGVSYSPLETSIVAVIEVEEFDLDDYNDGAIGVDGFGAFETQLTDTGFIKVEVTFQTGDELLDPLPDGGLHTITSNTADSPLNDGAGAGNLKLEASQDSEDIVSFIAGSDKVFILGSSPGVLNVKIGELPAMVLTGFEFLLDAGSDDVYDIDDLENVIGDLALIDDLGDRDTIKVGDDAVDYDGGPDELDTNNGGPNTGTISLEVLNDVFAFDFDVLDVTTVTEEDLIIVGDDNDQDNDLLLNSFDDGDYVGDADIDGDGDTGDGGEQGDRDTTALPIDGEADDIVVGKLSLIDSITLFQDIWFTAASITDSGATYVLDTANDELENNNSVLLDTDARGLNFSLLATAVTASVTGNANAVLVGGSAGDTLTGGGGADIIVGGGGADTLLGGSTAEVQTIDLNVQLAADTNFAFFDWLGNGTLVLTEALVADTDYTDGLGAVVDGAGLSVVGPALAKLLDDNLVLLNQEWQNDFAAPNEVITDVSYAANVLTFTFRAGVNVANLADIGFNANGDGGVPVPSATSEVVPGSDGGADTFVFEATAAKNGADTINSFQAFTDVLDFSAYFDGTLLGPIGVFDFGAFVGTISDNRVVYGYNKATLAAADFNGAGDNLFIGDGAKTVFITTGDTDGLGDATTPANPFKVYYVYDSDADIGDVSVKVELVATVNSTPEIDVSSIVITG